MMWRLTKFLVYLKTRWLPVMCTAATALVIAAAAAQAASMPVLQVMHFGVGAGKAGAEAGRQPGDFEFENSGSPGVPHPARRLTGPVTVAHDDSWQTVASRLLMPAHTWVDSLLQGDRTDWPRRPLIASKVWIEWNEQLAPLAVYYSPFSRQMSRATFVAGKIAIQQARRNTAFGNQSAALADAPLYAAAGSVGLPDAIADQISEIFAGVLDFHLDLHDDYQGVVAFDMVVQPDQSMRPGRVLAAHLGTRGGSYSAYLLEGKQGGASVYIAADGTPLQRKLLRSPLVFSRITSGYTVRRFHPILQHWQAHNGIDFAAPTGTSVRVTAAGVVEFAGMRGGYGNLVVVRHAAGLMSWYGHLSQIGKRITPGAPLSQGDVIGAVGMSGLATGPHLHYELRRSGVAIDPATAGELVPAPIYDHQEMQRIDHLVQWYEDRIEASVQSRAGSR